LKRAAADDFSDLLERIGGGSDAFRHHHRLRLHFRQEMRQQRERGGANRQTKVAIVGGLERLYPFHDDRRPRHRVFIQRCKEATQVPRQHLGAVVATAFRRARSSSSACRHRR